MENGLSAPETLMPFIVYPPSFDNGEFPTDLGILFSFYTSLNDVFFTTSGNCISCVDKFLSALPSPHSPNFESYHLLNQNDKSTILNTS
jgi:hypothetical protein